MLHLIYRLVVQPNTSRAQTFAEAFINCGGLETLLVLLQREAKAGDCSLSDSMTKSDETLSVQGPELDSGSRDAGKCQDDEEIYLQEKDLSSNEKVGESQLSNSGSRSVTVSPNLKIERMASENAFMKNLGGISLSISADNARNNVYNIDKSDGIVLGIIGLIGVLVASGHLKFGSRAPSDAANNLLGSTLQDGGGTMFDDKVSLLLFALQKAFQAAPNRLMTSNVYATLLGASV